ncbi:universal stress protein UspA [Pelagivirga sediminicola]|uniref:Universal stress protein n=1 Tax=Pelagivirga sediminicola TaxID=2170575 RepID=A0A2T7G539_9RHOB|nr:universal stress protein [Pelagivirga sediminicola]PVA09525.1 universal stress protein UspA [Pelagivirga sediminicola]
MYKHILISTDGSELAMKGVEHGLALGKENASKITVITVSQPYPLQSAATLDSWSAAQKRHAEDALLAVKGAAEKLGVEIATRQAVNDSAAEGIVDTARDLGCDLIVMASHGRRGVSRLLLGSQTSEVVSHSPIPVLVVR